MEYEEFQNLLNDFHKKKEIPILEYESPIAGDEFPGEFNVSGYHKEILNLDARSQSLWGIDQCVRIREGVDDYHSLLFHMGIFAQSVDLKQNFINPFSDERYESLQSRICTQFFELLEVLGVDSSELEATVAGRVTIGGDSGGRDALLGKVYELGPDVTLKRLLEERQIKVFEVSGLANVDVHPVEGSLVGLRAEVAFRGIEIATIVFDSFRIVGKHLEPINYIGGYAIGVERLYALLEQGTIVTSIPRYQAASAVLIKQKPELESKLVKDEYLKLLYGTEVLTKLTGNYSRHQKEHLRKLSGSVEETARELGVETAALREMYSKKVD